MTPSRIVTHRRELELLAYRRPRAGEPAILLVPAPIKTAYIWDLGPGSSVVERCLAAGLQVYLVAWRRPRDADTTLGLADYADAALRACVDAITAETGQKRVFVAGHSLGGTLAAIFASLHPLNVRGLIELEGPMAFGAGSIEEVLSRVSPSQTAAMRPPGNVAGAFLNAASVCVDPRTFAIEPWLDALQSSMLPRCRRLHWRVRRWTLDETPMARRLYEDVERGLYREDRFARGQLTIAGRIASPRAIAAPVLAVFDPRSRIVPPESMLAYRSQTGSADVRTLEYDGEVGVVIQHLGVLVGPRAHARVWPQITSWIRSRS